MFKPQKLIFPPKVQTNPSLPARHHNYSVGGEIVNAFAAGAIGSTDDFWFVAGEPAIERADAAPTALIWANLLDAFGRPLLGIEANRLTHNPRGCVLSEAGGGLQVAAADGREVLRIESPWVKAAACHISYIHGTFKGKNGAVRMEARRDGGSFSLVMHGKHAVGLRPGRIFAVNRGLSEAEMAAALALLGDPA